MDIRSFSVTLQTLLKKIEEEILFLRFLTRLSSPFSIDNGMISRGWEPKQK